MQGRPEQDQVDNPLRHLTPAQFMALGGNAVVYIRPIKGKKLSEMMDEGEIENADEEVVEAEREKREEAIGRRAKILEALERLKGAT